MPCFYQAEALRRKIPPRTAQSARRPARVMSPGRGHGGPAERPRRAPDGGGRGNRAVFPQVRTPAGESL